MKKYLLLLAFAMIGMVHAQAQKKFGTRKGEITFYSDAKLEKIEAVNKSVSAVIDTKSRKLQFAVLVKGFHFKKALMEEHFNENYLESSKYPKATFKGNFVEEVDFFHAGEQNVHVKGNLTIHGVTKEVTLPVTISASKEGIQSNCNFTIKLADYEIDIPSMVAGKIAETIEIKVSTLMPMVKR